MIVCFQNFQLITVVCLYLHVFSDLILIFPHVFYNINIYACFKDFKLFQMDVKSDFLNGYINKEVYVSQPPSFENHEYPTLFIKHRGKVDIALFVKRQGKHTILV